MYRTALLYNSSSDACRVPCFPEPGASVPTDIGSNDDKISSEMLPVMSSQERAKSLDTAGFNPFQALDEIPKLCATHYLSREGYDEESK